jgi:hypothetical protein
MAEYLVVQVWRSGVYLWAVERSAKGEAPQLGPVFKTRQEAEAEAARLSALDEKAKRSTKRLKRPRDTD